MSFLHRPFIYMIDRTTILDVNFAALSPGAMSAAAFLAATGLTFTRSSSSYIQSSGSAVETNQAAVDEACIGNQSSILTTRGLIVEPNIRNIATLNCRQITTANGWSSGSGILSTGVATGVNGATGGATAFSISSGGYWNYQNATSSLPECISAFFLPTTDQQMSRPISVNNSGTVGLLSAGASWGRTFLTKSAASGANAFDVCDGRDFSGVGGQTARARSGAIDMLQWQNGAFPTTPIVGATTTRSNDRVSYATGSDLIAKNGQIKFYLACTPMGGASQEVWNYSTLATSNGVLAYTYLYSWGSGSAGVPDNYARIRASDQKLCVRIAGGTEVVSTNAIAWSRNDFVEIYISMGNNVASIAQYRINGATWINLTLATIATAPAPSGVFSFFLNNQKADNDLPGQFPMWVHQLKMYNVGDAS